MDLTDSHTLLAAQEYGLRIIEAKSRKKQPVVLRNSTVSFILSLPLFFVFLESIQSAKLPSLLNFVDDSRVRANWITTWCQNQTETAWRNISSFSSSIYCWFWSLQFPAGNPSNFSQSPIKLEFSRKCSDIQQEYGRSLSICFLEISSHLCKSIVAQLHNNHPKSTKRVTPNLNLNHHSLLFFPTWLQQNPHFARIFPWTSPNLLVATDFTDPTALGRIDGAAHAGRSVAATRQVLDGAGAGHQEVRSEVPGFLDRNIHHQKLGMMIFPTPFNKIHQTH